MDTSTFKNIVGEIRQGEPATIRFYGKITEQSAAQFNNEFDYVESIRPSVIRVLINCEGGSVMHGMSSYATIQNSAIPTECINEGMAASMGSVIWAAGNRSLMRDYAILMIHNPFLPSADAAASDLVLAFQKQIQTIYRKRFCLSADHIQSIMTGKAGKDGTFFDADSAVRAGIIPRQNILNTSPQLCDKVRIELSSLENVSDIQSMMSRISAEATALEQAFKPSDESPPNLSQTITNTDRQMTEETKTSPEYSAVAATLGMKDNFQVKDVMARISELVSIEAKFKEKDKALSDTQTVIAGKDATIQNLQTNLNEVTASLKVYQDKEAAEKKTRIESIVNTAEAEGKIEKADIQKWMDMAEANLELTESILAAIPAKEQISKEIANDSVNVQAAADATKTVEQKMAERVTAVVGEDFEFKKIG